MGLHTYNLHIFPSKNGCNLTQKVPMLCDVNVQNLFSPINLLFFHGLAYQLMSNEKQQSVIERGKVYILG